MLRPADAAMLLSLSASPLSVLSGHTLQGRTRVRSFAPQAIAGVSEAAPEVGFTAVIESFVT